MIKKGKKIEIINECPNFRHLNIALKYKEGKKNDPNPTALRSAFAQVMSYSIFLFYHTHATFEL